VARGDVERLLMRPLATLGADALNYIKGGQVFKNDF
jgi:hypothetical protein